MNKTTLFCVMFIAGCVTVLQAIALLKGIDGRVVAITIGILAFLAGLLSPQLNIRFKGWNIELLWNMKGGDKGVQDTDSGNEKGMDK